MSPLRKYGLVRILPVLFTILCAPKLASAAPSIQILKLDPSPVQVGAPLMVIYSIGNTGAAQATFQIQLVINSPLTFQYQTVPAGGTQVLNWGTTVSTPGNMTVTLNIWEQVGTRVVETCPG
jgi:hypothetical protein